MKLLTFVLFAALSTAGAQAKPAKTDVTKPATPPSLAKVVDTAKSLTQDDLKNVNALVQRSQYIEGEYNKARAKQIIFEEMQREINVDFQKLSAAIVTAHGLDPKEFFVNPTTGKIDKVTPPAVEPGVKPEPKSEK